MNHKIFPGVEVVTSDTMFVFPAGLEFSCMDSCVSVPGESWGRAGSRVAF